MPQHRHEIELPVSAERAFAILHTPSAICQWWSAAKAVVVPQQGGLWRVLWGSSEQHPDAISEARIAAFDPPHRLLLTDFRHVAKDRAVPFEADLATEFTLEPRGNGCLLRVVQTTFPDDPITEAFSAATALAWPGVLEAIRRCLTE